MEWIEDEENDWDHRVKGDAVEGPIFCVCREVVQVLIEMKTVKDPGSFDIILESIVASGEVGLQAMAKTCLRVLDGFEMPVELALGIILPTFKAMRDFINCSRHRAV